MTTVFVENYQFKQMLSYKPYVETKTEQKKVKYTLLDFMKSSIGDKWQRLKEGTKQVYDMICFLGSELGFSYASDLYLAEKYNVSISTVNKKFKELEDLGEVVRVYRRSSKHNGRGKPIFLFVHHPYFKYWKRFLKLDYKADYKAEKSEKPTDTREREAKKVSTYSLPFYKNNTLLDTAFKHPRSLKNSIPKVIYDGLAPYFNADELYKIYGILLRAKSIDKNIRLEEHGESYIDVFLNAIRKAKLGEIDNLEGYLYKAWKKVTKDIRKNKYKQEKKQQAESKQRTRQVFSDIIPDWFKNREQPKQKTKKHTNENIDLEKEKREITALTERKAYLHKNRHVLG